MLVRLVYPEEWQTTFRHIPDFDPKVKSTAKIGNVVFTTDKIPEADLVVIVNFTPYDLNIRAREAWIFHHEPGNEKHFGHWQKAYKYADRVFGSWSDFKKIPNLQREQASIFWQCRHNYEFYKSLVNPEKTKLLSAITSSKTTFEGHRARLEFLKKLQKEFSNTDYAFELYGRGINDFDLKEDILIPSKYTIAIENVRENDYFSEKLTDAFLCNTVPVYFGAPNIFEYFPKNSLILLEDLDVEKAKRIIKLAIDNNFYEKNLESVLIAKDLVLNRYNFFMSLVEKIERYNIASKPVKKINIPKNRQMKHPYLSKIKRTFKQQIRRYN